MKYHPSSVRYLTRGPEAAARTVSGGRFDWGGYLLKSNGGAQRSPRAGWKSAYECKGDMDKPNGKLVLVS